MTYACQSCGRELPDTAVRIAALDDRIASGYCITCSSRSAFIAVEVDVRKVVHRDPHDTEVEAASRLKKSGRAANLQRAIMRAFQSRHPIGFTDDELCGLFADRDSSVRTRRHELTEAGYLRDTGQKEPTITGYQAKVWSLTRKGVNTDV